VPACDACASLSLSFSPELRPALEGSPTFVFAQNTRAIFFVARGGKIIIHKFTLFIEINKQEFCTTQYFCRILFINVMEF
jgi:hypothetical protein